MCRDALADKEYGARSGIFFFYGDSLVPQFFRVEAVFRYKD
jgi:hypothetical protein